MCISSCLLFFLHWCSMYTGVSKGLQKGYSAYACHQTAKQTELPTTFLLKPKNIRDDDLRC